MSYTDVFGGQTVPPSEYSYVKYTLTEDAQLYWPGATPPGELSVAKITEVSAAVPVIITLYMANQLSVGFDFIIANSGSDVVIVNDYDGGELYAIDPGSKIYLYLVQNTSENGLWTTTEYGASTSEAQASELAGQGLAERLGKLVLNAPTIVINSDYTLQAENLGHLLLVGSGSITLTLPVASSLDPTGFYCFLKNNASGSTSVVPAPPETIDGSLSKTLAPGEAGILFATGSGWVTVGYGRDVDFAFTEFVVNAAAADPTLTASEVSGRMIRVAGIATGTKTITLPPVAGIYFVITDAGMGIFSAVFTTGSGSTVAIPANQSTVLYSDGTNIRIAVTTSVESSLSLVDGSPVAPSLNWATGPTTGFYRAGLHSIGFTANGVASGAFSSAGWTGPVVATSFTVSDPAAARASLGAAASGLVVSAGVGLTGGGSLTEDRALALGTPGTLSTLTINQSTGTTHTHQVTFPVISVAGKSGPVVLDKNDVGLSNVANTDTTNASNISSGTLSNARTTGVSVNTANTLVARGASGEFAAGSITCTGTVSASVNLTLTSDVRLKHSISSIPPQQALCSVLQLRPVSYFLCSDPSRKRIGLIAQELLKTVPEVVDLSADGTFSVAYQNLVALLIGAIQEQQSRITELEQRIQ